MDRLDEYRQFIQHCLRELCSDSLQSTDKLKAALLLTANKTIFY
jgi:hypothetical protein